MSPSGTACGWCMRCASCVKMPCTYWNMAPKRTCFQRAMSIGSCVAGRAAAAAVVGGGGAAGGGSAGRAATLGHALSSTRIPGAVAAPGERQSWGAATGATFGQPLTSMTNSHFIRRAISLALSATLRLQGLQRPSSGRQATILAAPRSPAGFGSCWGAPTRQGAEIQPVGPGEADAPCPNSLPPGSRHVRRQRKLNAGAEGAVRASKPHESREGAAEQSRPLRRPKQAGGLQAQAHCDALQPPSPSCTSTTLWSTAAAHRAS